MADQSTDLGRASSKEQNNFKEGRSGAATPKLPGPVKSVAKNPTQGGGINNSTKGR